MINEKKIEKAKNKLKKSSEKPLVVLSQDDLFNRKMVEYGKFDVLLSPERKNLNDSIRKINSGF